MVKRFLTPYTPARSRLASTDGFSLVEVLTAVALLSVMMATALLVTRTTLGMSKTASSAQQLRAALRAARETSIAERRNINVRFIAPNIVQLTRRNVVGTAETGEETVLETVPFEFGAQFRPLPSTVPDTPEEFGRSGAIDFGDAEELIFTPEGQLVDQAGDPVSGSIFLSLPTDGSSIHAVTISGPTAMVRTFRWNGRAWVE
jgi:prepilin-type N-terminal cleavage/methylation domain-containing protein